VRYCPECAGPLETRQIDGVPRTACSKAGCGFVHYDNPAPVVAALVLQDRELLLARNVAWPEGLFSMISGFLERDETPEQAVLREVKEELGLAGGTPRFIGYYPFFKRNQLILAFAVEATGEPVFGDELAELRRVPREALAGYPFGPLALTEAIVGDWLTMPEA